ncbi:hypothetical protein Tco_0602699, partial [Tanacetum coccineum]
YNNRSIHGEKMEDLGTMEKMEKMTGRHDDVEDGRWRR